MNEGCGAEKSDVGASEGSDDERHVEMFKLAVFFFFFIKSEVNTESDLLFKTVASHLIFFAQRYQINN